MRLFQARLRTSVVAVGAVVAALLSIRHFTHGPGERANALTSSAPSAAGSPLSRTRDNESAALAERLSTICRRAGGMVGVTVIHVETGRTVSIEGTKRLPLYSVFKLPLAVSVLKEVEENRLRLDQKLRVTPAEVVPGWQGNTALWRKTVERTVAELLELSLVRSDNTSSDKLLQLVGGPAEVTRRMRGLGFQDIDIRSSVREFAALREHPNTGTASDLARLLARLQQGELLQAQQRELLLGLMRRAMTGERRLRGDLPPGTQVADKTGTGAAGSATNDVGIITLPEGRGHLAIAVLLSGSKLPVEAQEKLIAELARTAYDAHVPRTTSKTRAFAKSSARGCTVDC